MTDIFTYITTYRRCDTGSIETKVLKARCFGDALKNYCNECYENGRDGIFFSLLTDAQAQDETRKDKRTRYVHTRHGDFGIYLIDLMIDDNGRSKASNELRARREMLGLSAEEFGRMAGSMTYKAYETGLRPMDLFDFLWYYGCLSHYKNGQPIGERPSEFTGSFEDAIRMISDLTGDPDEEGCHIIRMAYT